MLGWGVFAIISINIEQKYTLIIKGKGDSVLILLYGERTFVNIGIVLGL